MSESVAEIFAAIEAGDVAALHALLVRQPAQGSARHPSGATALVFALYLRRPDLAEVVRASLPSLDFFEASATGDDARVAALLVADPASVHAWTPDGFTALHLAAFFARPLIVRRLLEAGADPSATSRNAMQVQPLHSALSARAQDVTMLLLEAGAPPDAAQQQGWTALMSAAMHGDDAMADLLLRFGASRAPVEEGGRTASDLALEKGFVQLAERLRPPGAAPAS